MTTVLEAITGSAKLLGVLFKNETLSADEATDGLNALNDMINSWSNDSSLTYANTTEYFTLASGTEEYTIGSGGGFNTTRPISISYAFIRDGSIDYPMTIIPDAEYEAIAYKGLQAGIPRLLNYSNEYPLSTISIYPSPSANYQIWLISKKPLPTYTALTDTITFPVGWIKAIKENLALELAPQYGVEPSATLVRRAMKSMGDIKRTVAINTPNTPLGSSQYSGYNILGGWL